MNLTALTDGPITDLTWAFLITTGTADWLTIRRRSPRWCCTPNNTWRYHLDALLGTLIPARIIAWAYVTLGDLARAITGEPRGWIFLVEAIVIVGLCIEMNHRRNNHRRKRRPARAAGRVINLGHRLAVTPTPQQG